MEPSQVQDLTIVEGGFKTFILDYGTDFENLREIKMTNIDKEYISFYDRITHAIYLYDFNTGELSKKIKMEKEGPNEVKGVSRFFFHTMDSIFIDSSYGIYLIDSRAEVIAKKSKGSKGSLGATILLDLDTKAFRFTKDSRFTNGQIEMTSFVMNRRSEDYEYAIFDFEKDSISKELIKTKTIISDYGEVLNVQEEAHKRRGWTSNIIRFFNGNKNHLYCSTSISDSLYVFNEGELIKTIYAGVPSIDVADYPDYASRITVAHFEGGMNFNENPKQSAYYKSMLLSPDGRFIYRLFYHGAKPRFVKGKEKPSPIGATLIVVDLQTEALGHYDLPIGEVELAGNSFVSNSGIYLRVKDQKNEDEVQFRFFKLIQ